MGTDKRYLKTYPHHDSLQLAVEREDGPGHIALTYCLQGDLSGLDLPPAKTDGDLWKFSCFELFFFSHHQEYIEWNWNMRDQEKSYHFSSYRKESPSIAPSFQQREFLVSEKKWQSKVILPNLFPKGFLQPNAIIFRDKKPIYFALDFPFERPDFHKVLKHFSL